MRIACQYPRTRPGASPKLALAATLALALGLMPCVAKAADKISSDGAWTSLDREPALANRADLRDFIRADHFRPATVNADLMENALADAPLEFTEAARQEGRRTIFLPTPDGDFMEFYVQLSPVMEPELYYALREAGFDLRTYKVQAVENGAITGRIEWGGPKGFHGMVTGTEKGAFFIDPLFIGNQALHASYWRTDYASNEEHRAFRCHNDEFEASIPPVKTIHQSNVGSSVEEREIIEREQRGPRQVASVDRGGSANLRTLRLAMAATGGYTIFHSANMMMPTAAEGQAAIVTAVNRINQIYERDAAIRFLLVGTNVSVVYTDPLTDPYTDGNTGTMITENQTNLDAVIMSANYDIGHVVGSGGSGGLAPGRTCTATKAQGATTRNNPVGDPFDIDYTAHELGHQLSGQHTWSHYFGSGIGHGLPLEPGSGVTIMGYAGVAPADVDNLAQTSDAMFHNRTIEEFDTYLAGGGNCRVNVAIANASQPTVEAGANYTIPVSTFFELEATMGADADGDTVTYSWEQNDLGPTDGSQVNVAGLPAATSGPLFRTHLPAANGNKRVFPPLANILAGTTPPPGEALATAARAINFRCVVRDNNAEGGRHGFDSMIVTTRAGTPFTLTAPNGGETWTRGEMVTVTWNVASTNAAPINSPMVDIYLSTNSGASFGAMPIAAAVPNTGTATFVLPHGTPGASMTARVKIKGHDHIFFDISDMDFNIVAIPDIHVDPTDIAVP